MHGNRRHLELVRDCSGSARRLMDMIPDAYDVARVLSSMHISL
jgi:hypothetical protein